MQRASGLPLAFGGPVATDRKSFTIHSLHGTRTRSLAQLKVTHGEGMGGRVLAERRPLMVDDYFNEDRITQRYHQVCAPEDLRTVLGLPVMVQGAPQLIVYLSARQFVRVEDRVLDAVQQIAQSMGRELLIENEVQRRVAAAQRSGPPTPLVDELFDELLSIAQSSDDPWTRVRLEELIAARVVRSPEIESADSSPLTAREAEVLRWVERGLTNAQIAEECGLLLNTIKSYVKSAIAKTQAANRIQAARAARRHGWLR